MGELPKKNIQKNDTTKGRRRQQQPTETTVNVNMDVDEATLRRIAAESNKKAMDNMPDLFDNIIAAARTKELQLMQLTMGDRLFADCVFRGPIRMRDLGVRKGVWVLQFGGEQLLYINFDTAMDGAIVRFDEAAGTNTRHFLHATPHERVEHQRTRLEIWSRRRALDLPNCTCLPELDEGACLVTAAFTDGSEPLTLRFPSGPRAPYETYKDAAAAALSNWEDLRKWKTDAAEEPADLVVEFAVFRKLRSINLVAINTKCAFRATYYAAEVEAPKEAPVS